MCVYEKVLPTVSFHDSNSGGEFPMLTLWPYKLRLLYIVFAQRIPPVFPCIIHRWNSFSHTHTHEGWRGGDQIRSDKRFRNNPPSCLSLIQYFVCVVEREKAFRNSGWNREPWEKNEFLAFLHTHANSTSWWWWWWWWLWIQQVLCVCVCTIWFEPYNLPPPLFFIYQVV